MRLVPAITMSLVLALAAAAEETSPILKSTRPVVSVREGEILRKDTWRLAPELKPDVYEAELRDGVPKRVTFITDIDSIGFDVEEGKHYDFVIQNGTDLCMTRIVGVRWVPAAVFDASYQAAHAGTISVEIPEVYELVNVAIAMTPTGLADRDLVFHDSDYYESMREWFDVCQDHPAIAALEMALKQSPSPYAYLKMNGYAFEFDEADRIVQSRIYDRTAFPGERSNSLRPFISALQSFADVSKFRTFYRQNSSTYAEQIGFYERTANVGAMLDWLNRNFPATAGYNSYKIILSPLVAYSQSATWLESDGFRELQAHVNYPYPSDTSRRTSGAKLSREAETVLRGDIVFTELNHGYINPETDKYADRVAKAISRRDLWIDPARGSDYYGGNSTFNEYMNWGLVCLRVVDLLPAEEQQTLITVVDQMMAKGRGFSEFAAFSAFLVDLYRHRNAGQTIADLYPQIIEWFEKRNAMAPEAATPDRK